MEWLELGVKVRLYSSAVKLGQEQETAGQVQVQPDAQVGRQADNCAGHFSSRGLSRCQGWVRAMASRYLVFPLLELRGGSYTFRSVCRLKCFWTAFPHGL